MTHNDWFVLITGLCGVAAIVLVVAVSRRRDEEDPDPGDEEFWDEPAPPEWEDEAGKWVDEITPEQPEDPQHLEHLERVSSAHTLETVLGWADALLLDFAAWASRVERMTVDEAVHLEAEFRAHDAAEAAWLREAA